MTWPRPSSDWNRGVDGCARGCSTNSNPDSSPTLHSPPTRTAIGSSSYSIPVTPRPVRTQASWESRIWAGRTLDGCPAPLALPEQHLSSFLRIRRRDLDGHRSELDHNVAATRVD